MKLHQRSLGALMRWEEISASRAIAAFKMPRHEAWPTDIEMVRREYEE
jgi:hypothetical protein